MTDDAPKAATRTTTLAVVAPLDCTEFRVPNPDGKDDLVVTRDGTEVPSGAAKDLAELAAGSGVTLAEKE